MPQPTSTTGDGAMVTPGTHVALLRGINVGGKNRLPMKELAALFTAAGCREVRAYIQSGNVLFAAGPALVGGLSTLISKAIADQFGLRVPVVLRSAEELREVAENNPFVRTGAASERLHVGFLADLPDAARIGTLDPDRSPPDAFLVRGREIYLHCPNGMARTRLTTEYFDSKLATTSTIRSWRTVLTLLEMV